MSGMFLVLLHGELWNQYWFLNRASLLQWIVWVFWVRGFREEDTLISVPEHGAFDFFERIKFYAIYEVL